MEKPIEQKLEICPTCKQPIEDLAYFAQRKGTQVTRALELLSHYLQLKASNENAKKLLAEKTRKEYKQKLKEILQDEKI